MDDTTTDGAATAATSEAPAGETVHIWGEGPTADSGTVVVTADSLSLRVTGPTAGDVAVGDQIQVYGRLATDRRLIATAYDVQSPGGLRRMYLVSIVGIALAAGAFLRRWRVDIDQLAFVPREGE